MRRISIIIFLLSGLILFFILNGSKYFSLENLGNTYKHIDVYVKANYIFSALIFASIYIATVFFSIPIKPILKMIAGLLFGLWLGFTVCLISATTGAMLAFLFIKYSWGEVSSKPKYRIVSKFKSLVENNPITILFVSRLLPIPFFVPNILAGILKIKNTIFLFTTLIGIVPVTFIYVWFGTHLEKTVLKGNVDNFIDTKFILAISILGILALVPLLFRKKL
nr:VTT domain-containing protein [Francisella frigiditurris]